MAYTRTTWVNGSSPYVNATNLNNIEAGIVALDTRNKQCRLVQGTGKRLTEGVYLKVPFATATYGGSGNSDLLNVDAEVIYGFTIPAGYTSANIMLNAEIRSTDEAQDPQANTAGYRTIYINRYRGSTNDVLAKAASPSCGSSTFDARLSCGGNFTVAEGDIYTAYVLTSDEANGSATRAYADDINLTINLF
jgi:hypothetical protein